jgi:hypothetical protein
VLCACSSQPDVCLLVVLLVLWKSYFGFQLISSRASQFARLRPQWPCLVVKHRFVFSGVKHPLLAYLVLRDLIFDSRCLLPFSVAFLRWLLAADFWFLQSSPTNVVKSHSVSVLEIPAPACCVRAQDHAKEFLMDFPGCSLRSPGLFDSHARDLFPVPAQQLKFSSFSCSVLSRQRVLEWRQSFHFNYCIEFLPKTSSQGLASCVQFSRRA